MSYLNIPNKLKVHLEWRRFILPVLVFGIGVNLNGCALVDRVIPVPESLVEEAGISGYKNIRYSIGNSEQRLTQLYTTVMCFWPGMYLDCYGVTLSLPLVLYMKPFQSSLINQFSMQLPGKVNPG